MPFIPHTPESLIPRSDSKNPATTCKGLTSSGRPCRRALAASPASSPNTNRSARDGVLASSKDHHEGAAAFYCWQHKAQAAVLTANERDGTEASVVQIRDRTSVDTLVDRLGLIEVNADLAAPNIPRRKKDSRPTRMETLPMNYQHTTGPLVAAPGKTSSKKSSSHQPVQRKAKAESSCLLSLLCCVRSAETQNSSLPPVRRQTIEVNRPTVQTAKIPSYLQPDTPKTPTPAQRRRHHSSTKMEPANLSPINNPIVPSNRPAFPREPSSQTQSLLSLIPITLSPQTTSLLLAELAKPISPYDEEGFIYMFWLTPSDSPTPTAEATSCLLTTPARPAPSRHRTSEIVREYAPMSSRSTDEATILLKIGRANNVQRRMNEWSRQCNHNLSLIRYYPHTLSAPSSQHISQINLAKNSITPNAAFPLKVPNAHKVERLIHLELADLRVRRSCAACGKEHREWFEVDGNRKGVCKVDAVVKRWVEWSLGMDQR
ncbi:hypothetical protein MMC07_007851 [Pseudocyphellaria aurata]|nr:hypothetical protein [Pseudocyphellaria aurata]